MKTLFVNRHAKSNHDMGVARDFDRSLHERGLGDALDMGLRLKTRGEHIDGFVSSPATRAISTARLIAKEVHYPLDDIAEVPEIYNANVNSLMKVINAFDPDDNAVIMFGHNPGFSELIGHLTGQEIGTLPTCGIAKIVFAEAHSWKEVSRGTGMLEYLDHPANDANLL